MTASRLAGAFAAARGRTGLIPFLTAGFPSLDDSLDVMRAFADEGALAIEVGIPFSDPIADGADIQRASEWALARGTGARDALKLIESFRREHDTPVVVMTYFNPVLRSGIAEFSRQAVSAGVDGVLISDLPADEAPEAWRAFDDARLDTVMLVAPTTAEARLAPIVARARGFLYCLSRTGVTGRASGYSGSIPERVAALRARTTLPIAIGFGISSAEDVSALRGVADALVVGAAFTRAIAEDPGSGAAARAGALAAQLVAALG